MKVKVTHLKAPWPAGAVVGDVVELPGDVIPGFFAGKCTPADADAQAAHVFVPAPPPAVVAATAIAAPAEQGEDAALRKAAEQEADELRGMVERATAKLDEATAALVARDAEIAELKAKLDEATAALAAKKGKATT